jgi:hypothetical protein
LLDLRVALVVSGGTFLVSLITSLLGGALFFTALLRGLVFAGSFFGIVAGIYFIYNKFLIPDDTDDTETPKVGQNIDYSVGDNGEWLNMRETANESLTLDDIGVKLDGQGGGSGTEADAELDSADGLEAVDELDSAHEAETVEEPSSADNAEVVEELASADGLEPVDEPASADGTGGADGAKDGTGLDAVNKADAGGGLDAPYGADAGNGGTEKPPGPSVDMDRGALEQKSDNVYIDREASGHKEPPTVAKATTAASKDHAFDIDMSGFVASLPVVDYGGQNDKAAPPSAAEWSKAGVGMGMVDMSVARESNAKQDLYSDADGKKMAGAIRSLLKKDEG